MGWTDTLRATALATLAERAGTPNRLFTGGPSGWNPDDVWLRRASQPRGRATQRPLRDPATPHRHGVAPND